MAASASSRVLIIGQAPGRIAHETGVPWNDQSGRRLRGWLGVTDAQFYDESLFAIVPMGLCYPGRGKGGDLPPRSECAAHWHPRILPRLTAVELTIYIGRYAFEGCLAEEAQGLTQGIRAAAMLLPRRILLPHPSPRNHLWVKRNPWFERDVLPALRRRIREILPRCNHERDAVHGPVLSSCTPATTGPARRNRQRPVSTPKSRAARSRAPL